MWTTKYIRTNAVANLSLLDLWLTPGQSKDEYIEKKTWKEARWNENDRLRETLIKNIHIIISTTRYIFLRVAGATLHVYNGKVATLCLPSNDDAMRICILWVYEAEVEKNRFELQRTHESRRTQIGRRFIGFAYHSYWCNGATAHHVPNKLVEYSSFAYFVCCMQIHIRLLFQRHLHLMRFLVRFIASASTINPLLSE